ncbi:hypothetical protein GMOD_00004145 [Pyrenophora seminiperda CCB06]|uniref:Uncharacterized protein n=1 Tax=Pyrenophora seminiperda CCB06 TaxID=1302712 RepID=A0A3M7M0K3_9PLEO|nr:hypothetical protein GMOD_00004145 [Pyrenophora seminiperda CCB06]
MVIAWRGSGKRVVGPGHQRC